jgi:hypothetical protein
MLVEVTQHTQNVLSTQVTIAAVGVAFIEWLKKNGWISKEADVLHRLFSAGIALVAALGVNYAWNAQAHSLTITGLSFWGIAQTAWLWLKQFVFNELTYRAAVKPNAPVAAKGT